MKLRLVRNATLALRTRAGTLLVDPLLASAGASPAEANTAPGRANPLPEPAADIPARADAVARRAPRVVAAHTEALTHCPVTRQELERHLVAAGVRDRVAIPAGGAARER